MIISGLVNVDISITEQKKIAIATIKKAFHFTYLDTNNYFIDIDGNLCLHIDYYNIDSDIGSVANINHNKHVVRKATNDDIIMVSMIEKINKL